MKHEVLCTLGLDNGEWAYYDFSEEEFQSLRFVENGREFWYNQKIHDVLSIERVNGKIQVKALPDEKETSLIQLLSEVHNQNDQNQNSGSLFFVFCGWVEGTTFISLKLENNPFVFLSKSHAPLVLPSGRNLATDAPPPKCRMYC